MIRICRSLSAAGYNVTLIGIKTRFSKPFNKEPYQQKRLTSWFTKGPVFYIEYNCRLLFYLLFAKADILCCIDLDTIIPVWLVSTLKHKQRVYDAHEYFSQQKEIITRPAVYKIWHWIEQTFVPRFKNGYTVGYKIAAEFKQLYKVEYAVIRNTTVLNEDKDFKGIRNKSLIYQGAINKARGLEYLIPAMKLIDSNLLIYGDGNYIKETKALIKSNNLGDKVFLKGKLLPEQLDMVTPKFYIGINLVEHTGLNQYYSLANKFFDYIHNLVPQVTMNFPEYKTINDQFEVAVLIEDLQTATIADGINKLLGDTLLYQKLYNNCITAREQLNWQKEEKQLLFFYSELYQKK